MCFGMTMPSIPSRMGTNTWTRSFGIRTKKFCRKRRKSRGISTNATDRSASRRAGGHGCLFTLSHRPGYAAAIRTPAGLLLLPLASGDEVACVDGLTIAADPVADRADLVDDEARDH